MDNITQMERLHYVKICGESRLFPDLIRHKGLKPHWLLHSILSVLFSEAAPKIILEINCSKLLQNYVETTSVLVVGHRPSYLQKLNYAA